MIGYGLYLCNIVNQSTHVKDDKDCNIIIRPFNFPSLFETYTLFETCHPLEPPIS